MLAASHAIGTNAVIEEEVATFLAGVLLARYPSALAERYGLAVEGTRRASASSKAVAKKRGCLIKGSGGELDMDKASLILLTDYRSGALGRISLETPADARRHAGGDRTLRATCSFRACSVSSSRNFGWAIAISACARCLADLPRNWATPYSVTT